jgi:hypothetical protein
LLALRLHVALFGENLLVNSSTMLAQRNVVAGSRPAVNARIAAISRPQRANRAVVAVKVQPPNLQLARHTVALLLQR